MERSEPTLVPEWLKTSSGSGAGSAGSNSQFASSFLHSDDHAVSKHARNRPSGSISEHDIGRPSFSDRTTSSYFRQKSSSNGSSQLRSYSSFGSFGRNQRDHRYHDYADPLGMPSRFEKDVLRRSQSSLTGRRSDSLPKKVVVESKNGNKSNHSKGDNLLAGVSVVNSLHKSAFERDFPSLGTEERQVNSEIGRVPSPGLSTSILNLPVGSSALIGSDGWTSALVEVHGAIGSNGMHVTSPQQTGPASSPSTPRSSATALNMAETVAQRPSRAGTPPLLSVETQRLEELVLKQSRQLVPMTPSMAKTQVLSPLEKGKPKIGQQHASHSTGLTLRGGPPPVKSDVPKTSLGKLHVLKPSRELNDVSSTAKDGLSPTSGSKVVNNPLGVPLSAAGSAPFRSASNNPNFTSIENKASPKTVEKKPSAQAKSRHDFFNLIKKKSSANSLGSPSALEKPGEVTTKPYTLHDRDASSDDTPLLDLSTKNVGEITRNGDGCDMSSEKVTLNGKKNSSFDTLQDPDEEEAAFLRSLGWEESTGEEEGLTEEEINAFYEEYLILRPSLKLRGMTTPKIIDLPNSQNGNCRNASSQSSSSDSEIES